MGLWHGKEMTFGLEYSVSSVYYLDSESIHFYDFMI